LPGPAGPGLLYIALSALDYFPASKMIHSIATAVSVIFAIILHPGLKGRCIIARADEGGPGHVKTFNLSPERAA